MMDDRFSGSYDAALHLLDRQVVDSEGLLVCKVDDIEIEERGDGLYAVAILVGRAALIPRLTGALGRRSLDFWRRMGDEQADRTAPYRIGFTDVAEVTSAVRLRRRRHALLVRADPAHRLRDLLEMKVRSATGAELGSVLDVRLNERQRVTDFIVGPGRPGSLLGYDRNREQGPWLIATIVRWLHRHAGCVPAEAAHIDWSAQLVTLDSAPGPLRPA